MFARKVRDDSESSVVKTGTRRPYWVANSQGLQPWRKTIHSLCESCASERGRHTSQLHASCDTLVEVSVI